MRPFRVFFSNRSADNDRVADLKAKLSQLLPNLPFDDVALDIPHQEDWREPARKALDLCDALVCVVGPETHLSEPVDWEIAEAYARKKPLVVTRLAREYQTPPCCERLGIPVAEWNLTELAGSIGELLLGRALFLNHDWRSGPPDGEAIWNQYSLMVQSWEALISRRQTVNTLYVSAAAALLAGVGVIVSAADNVGLTAAAFGILFLSTLGGALSLNWRRTVISYGLLSNAKAKVVGAMEAYMPARLFDAEWRVLEAKGYRSTTKMDKQTAAFFGLLFAVIAAVALVVLGVQLVR